MLFWEFIFKPFVFISIIGLILLYLLYVKYNKQALLLLRILRNTMVVLFKKNKEIKKNEFYHYSKTVFANNYLLIKFDFTNAIWFKFRGITTKSRCGEIVFNSINIESKEVILEVQGFFRKKVYKIQINPTHQIISDTFKTTISKLIDLNERIHIPVLKVVERKTSLNSFPIQLKEKSTQIEKKKIKIKLSAYNQHEFL